jgi:hypothetical protein
MSHNSTLNYLKVVDYFKQEIHFLYYFYFIFNKIISIQIYGVQCDILIYSCVHCDIQTTFYQFYAISLTNRIEIFPD